MATKRAKSPPQSPPRTRRAPSGGLLRVGNPGNKGGTGRPPDEFKALCREMSTRDATVTAVQSILTDATHPAFMAALKWATEHGYGRPPQSVEVSGGLTFTREQAAQRLAALVGVAKARKKA